MAAGGEGAPLVPAYHRALVEKSDVPKPVAVVNIGGVANITFIDGSRDPIAFDTGPGNAPIDDLVRTRTGTAHDLDGKLAAKGRVDENIVARVLADPFFALETAEIARSCGVRIPAAGEACRSKTPPPPPPPLSRHPSPAASIICQRDPRRSSSSAAARTIER